jgi:multidrug efflux pump subunit AcrA (membrane-fusion protein)
MVGGQERTWNGRIVRTGATVNSQTRLISAFGQVEDPYGKGADNGAPMAPGLFVTASIKGETIEGLTWAPRAALRGTDKIYVGVPDEHIMKIKPVDVVYTDATGVYMSGGVQPGELIITSSVQAAVNDLSVEVFEKLPDGELIPPPERKKKDEAGEGDEALVAGGSAEEGASQ